MRRADAIPLVPLLVVASASCIIPDLVSEDRACSPTRPCAAGYVCDVSRGRCKRPGDVLDLSVDAPPDKPPGDRTAMESPLADGRTDGRPPDKRPPDKRPPDKRPPDKAPPCPTVWRTAVAGKVVGVHVDPADGSIYVGGSTNAGGLQLLRLDKCGAIVGTASLAGSGAITSVSPVGTAQLVVGGRETTTVPWRGLVAVFDKSLVLKWLINPVLGVTSGDEIWDVTQLGQTIWAQGTLDIVQPAYKVWEVRAPLTGTSNCSFTPATGVARRLWTDGSAVYTTGTGANKGFVRHYTTACTVSCAGCAADWEASFQDGTSYTEGRAVLRVGADLYVAGHSVVGEDATALVFRISATSGATIAQVGYNQTALVELWDGATTDGASLYVAGVRNRSTTSPGEAVLRKLTLPGLQVQWTVAPAQDADTYRGVALTPDGGIIVVGAGFVRRCTTAGAC